MSSSFNSRNCCAVVLSGIVVALMIAAAVAPWYKYEDTTKLKVPNGNLATSTAGQSLSSSDVEQSATKLYYDLAGFKTASSGLCGTAIVSTYSNYGMSSNIRNIVKTSQAFVLMALLTGFVLLTLLFTFFFSRIRNKLIFAAGMTVTRLIAVLLAGIIVLSVLIAFLVFLGIVQAFKNDSQNCVDGPCRKFVDTVTTDTTGTGQNCDGSAASGTLEHSLVWGPVEGWYITLGTTIPAIILLLVVVVNKFPLPIDSEASSGEAL